MVSRTNGRALPRSLVLDLVALELADLKLFHLELLLELARLLAHLDDFEVEVRDDLLQCLELVARHHLHLAPLRRLLARHSVQLRRLGLLLLGRMKLQVRLLGLRRLKEVLLLGEQTVVGAEDGLGPRVAYHVLLLLMLLEVLLGRQARARYSTVMGRCRLLHVLISLRSRHSAGILLMTTLRHLLNVLLDACEDLIAQLLV